MTVVTVAVLAGAVVLLAAALMRQRRRFAPLDQLIEEMEKVDLNRPAPALPESIDGVGETEQVERIELAFLRMLRRLEAERRGGGGGGS
jgi:HAMP domain-containing protein